MVTQSRIQVGIVGKPNAGKSTFFAAVTLRDVKISPTPFTTIDPNMGVGYVRIDNCPCSQERCNPRNYIVIEGVCFAPVDFIDVAGLVPGAWQGRGLGNQFLDHLRRAPALIHVVDAAGSTDEEGRLVKPGSYDPARDVEFLEREISMWLVSILKRDWDRVTRLVEFSKREIAEVLLDKLAGLGITRGQIERALDEGGLSKKPPSKWNDSDFGNFGELIRLYSKPIAIAANKVDLPEGEEGYRKLKSLYPNRLVIPTSAEFELALRKAASKGLIRYKPGDATFEVVGDPTPQQKIVLDKIADFLKKWGSTGTADVIKAIVFDLLKYVVVYPVEDEKRLADRDGNVLPDLLIVPHTYTARDVAYAIHTELGERFVAAIDVKTGKKLSADAPVTNGIILKILAR